MTTIDRVVPKTSAKDQVTDAAEPGLYIGRYARPLRWVSGSMYFGAFWSLIMMIAGGHVRSPFGIITGLLSLFNIPIGASLFHVVVLVVLGYGITTRKRLGWWGFVFLQLLPLLTLIASGALYSVGWWERLDKQLADPLVIVAILLHLSLSVALLLGAVKVRRVFLGKLLPGSVFGAIMILVLGMGATIALGMGLQRVVFSRPLTDQSARWVLTGTLGRHLTSLLYGSGGKLGGPHWLTFLLGTLSALVVICSLVFFMRSQRMPGRTMEDDLFARHLLAHWDADSLGYFATRDDRSIVRSEDGRAAVSYGVASGVCMMGGDPLGDPQSWPDAVRQWLKLCAIYGWTPAAISVSADGARVLRQSGFSVHLMGDEAVIHTREFDLQAPSSKQLAQAVRRIKRERIDITIARQRDIDEADLKRLRAAAQEYRRGEERGFSMSLDRILTAEDERTVIVWAEDEDGKIHAMLSFVPWGHRGLSLSLMRRHPHSANGVIEAMVVELIARSQQLAIERISLNFAMFRQVFTQGEAVDAKPLDRIAYRLMRFASRFWQLHSLYESNARYAPHWVPRYLCARGVAELTYVGIAAGMLEGFVPRFGTATKLQWSPTPSYLEAVRRIDLEAVRDRLPRRRLGEQERVRRAKAEALQQRGREPYPPSVSLGVSPAEVLELEWAHPLEPGESSSIEVHCGGRITAIRDHGGVVFMDLAAKGSKVQVMLRADHLESDLDELRLLDRGDLVSVTGTLVRTRRGEVSVDAQAWQIAAKALRPLPAPGTTLDASTRTRERVSHLLATPTAVELLSQRSRALSVAPRFMEEAGYAEVETPMLHPVQGGANARPFVTHINAYSAEVFLRIAPELYLKRLAVAGMDAIFEIGRSFRNEGADATHNPEFTSMEAYRAGGDYRTMQVLTENLIKTMARALHGSEMAWRPVGSLGASEDETVVAHVDGVDLTAFDLSEPWPVIPVYEAISKAVGKPVTVDTTAEELIEIARQNELELPAVTDHANLIGTLYDELVESRTIAPTFYIDFPAQTSPLTRPHREDARLAERWDLVAFGMELGTAYTELTDPSIQRQRFTEQSLAAAAGDPEAMSIDEAFLADLERGLAPTGGLGLGMDRVCMALLGVNIRQLIAFPFVKPMGSDAD